MRSHSTRTILSKTPDRKQRPDLPRKRLQIRIWRASERIRPQKRLQVRTNHPSKTSGVKTCFGQEWFGPASPLKDLTGDGAPRWKQRAFYDFVKDLSILLIGVKVVRVAVWDRLSVGGTATTVKEILASSIDGSAHASFCEASSAALAALVRERAAN